MLLWQPIRKKPTPLKIEILTFLVVPTEKLETEEGEITGSVEGEGRP